MSEETPRLVGYQEVLDGPEVPKFGSVDHQSQVRPCYICALPCAEFAVFTVQAALQKPSYQYSQTLHRWCWEVAGGGRETLKSAR